MATIRLGRYEAREGNLPPVCMRCGRTATVYRDKVFTRKPRWMYFLLPLWAISLCWPLLILLHFFVDQRTPLRAPLCELHKSHWRGRSILFLAGLLACVLLVLLGLVLATGNDQYRRMEREWLGINLILLGGCVGPVLCLALSTVLHRTAIHEIQIAKYSITLTGVANEFVEAHRVQCQQQRGETEEAVPAGPSKEVTKP